ncbi:MAG TPA: VCBS repeat-containing protein, partial [Fimbriiglobus sp.]|nr:VCBS repeat-containing protein [Fimbriiglobus sp.]
MRLGKWVAVGLVLGAGTVTAADPPKDGFPKFKTQEIATDLTIGYAVLIADLNADKKPDIVVVDKHRVVWYENPTWKMRTILQGKTKPDNVCVAALDIDGGGDLELVLGAGWGAGTKVPGTLQWLKRGKSLDDEWTLHSIPCEEPTIHRVRTADLDGDGKPEIVVAPLHGRECTAKGELDRRPAGANSQLQGAGHAAMAQARQVARRGVGAAPDPVRRTVGASGTDGRPRQRRQARDHYGPATRSGCDCEGELDRRPAGSDRV